MTKKKYWLYVKGFKDCYNRVSACDMLSSSSGSQKSANQVTDGPILTLKLKRESCIASPGFWGFVDNFWRSLAYDNLTTTPTFIVM